VFESTVESVNPPVDPVIFGFKNVEFLLVNFDSANIDEAIDRQQRLTRDIAGQKGCRG
jgi:hypothetical protein